MKPAFIRISAVMKGVLFDFDRDNFPNITEYTSMCNSLRLRLSSSFRHLEVSRVEIRGKTSTRDEKHYCLAAVLARICSRLIWRNWQ